MVAKRQYHQYDASPIPARDLVTAVIASAALVLATTLAVAMVFGAVSSDLLVSAVGGVVFGALPAAVLGIGLLSAIGTRQAQQCQYFSDRAWTLGLTAVTVGSTIPGLAAVLMLHALCVAITGA